MEFLSHQQCAIHSKNGFGAVTSVIGAAAGIVHGDGIFWDPKRYGILPHGFRLVVVKYAVITTHQQFFHLAAKVQAGGCLHPVPQDWRGSSITPETRAEYDRQSFNWRFISLIDPVHGIKSCDQARQKDSK